MTSQGLIKKSALVGKHGVLSVASERGRKPASVETEEILALAVDETEVKAHKVRALYFLSACRRDVQWITTDKITLKVLQLFPYKMKQAEEL